MQSNLASFLAARGQLPPHQYLTMVLLALLHQCGELRIDARTIEKFDSSAILLLEWDGDAQQMVVRATSTPPLAFQINAKSVPSQPSLETPQNHRVMDEKAQREMEAERHRQQVVNAWKQGREEALSQMPAPSSHD